MPRVTSIVYDDKTVVPVAGLNTTLSETVAANVSTTALTEWYIVSVIAHEDLWFLIGDAADGSAGGDTLAPAADSGIPVFLQGQTVPFPLKAGKVIEASGKMTMVIHDIEE
jgi:hypothetical protein